MTLKELTEIVVNIRDNHLQHMKEDIDKMDAKLDKMDDRLWWIFTVIVGSIIGAVVAKLLGVI
jgi:hypothetical protein